MRLKKHLDKYSRDAERRIPGAGARAQQRVAILPELMDLCDLASLRRAAKSLKAKYERLDVVILNAGIGGWTGVDWIGAARQFFREGLGILHRPDYKIGAVGKVTKKQVRDVERLRGDEPALGEVFCANVFGHYLLAHYLVPLLSRKSSGSAPGRIVWVSTLEAYAHTFSLEDFQGIANPLAYESSKRLTDLLIMTADLEGTSEQTRQYFSPVSSYSSPASNDGATSGAESGMRSLRSSTRLRQTPTKNGSPDSVVNGTQEDKLVAVKPKLYLSHPGMCVTGIMPLPWVMIYIWIFSLYIARLCGSPWHTCHPYPAATSMVWLALADEKTLDNMDGGVQGRGKWGSAVNWLGKERVKRTVVDGWVDEKGDPVAKEERLGFERLGKQCWESMEELREEWERRLGDDGL